VRTCERNSSADTKVSGEGGGGDASGTGAEIPLQPMEKSTVRQVVPLQPMEVNGGADLVLQPMEDPTLEQFVPKGLHHMEKTHSGAACEERQPMENFMEDRLLWGGPQAGARDECEEEGEAETKL